MSVLKTIKSSQAFLFKDKGSKFIAIAYPFVSEDILKDLIERSKAEYPKASHYCYAYRIGRDKNNFRSNDDGEPKGSAGAPILNQIDSFGLTNICVVVVRYFGGTKLGVAGLINAYKSATKGVLDEIDIVEEEYTITYKLSCSYQDIHALIKMLNRNQISINTKVFGEPCSLTVDVKEDEEDNFLAILHNLHSIEVNIHKFEP